MTIRTKPRPSTPICRCSNTEWFRQTFTIKM